MASTISSIGQQGFGSGGNLEARFVHPDDLRTTFALALSQMYRNEVPLYGDLIRIVQGVNAKVLSNPEGASKSVDSLERLTLERHGAIRLGTPEELRTVRRIFALLGMQAVGYYDLYVAGLPMHATCFRPTSTSSLARNPFRVFTTLLRPELVRSDKARELASQLLARRRIFTQELIETLEIAESQDSLLQPRQAEVFIREALKTFSWQPIAAATHTEYQVLKAEHPILADIACFQTAHINHLTPRTLDITAAQTAMAQAGMAVKDRIEGPPPRDCPILLRQTSFLALEESIQFKCREENDQELVDGSHKARFGEIEERGAAVTPAGRVLYDQLLHDAMADADGLTPEAVDSIIVKTFQRYPDSWKELRKQGLVYSEYRCTGKPFNSATVKDGASDPEIIEKLIDEGVIEAVPITYEDFLPFSAAGIFQSNLQTSKSGKGTVEQDVRRPTPDQAGLEQALGCAVLDSDDLYSLAQRGSLNTCAMKLRS